MISSLYIGDVVLDILLRHNKWRGGYEMVTAHHFIRCALKRNRRCERSEQAIGSGTKPPYSLVQ
jgi:hypothetical protein